MVATLQVRDLLSSNPKNRLDIKEDPEKGVFVKDLTSKPVKSAAELDKVLAVRMLALLLPTAPIC